MPPPTPQPPVATAPAPPDAAVPSLHDAARDERLLALLWFQTSAEYRVLATTAFHAAQAALDRALADPAWSAAVEQSDSFAELPPAVIADIDETMLDNSPYEAESLLAGREHQPEAWSRWVGAAAAPAIPGAVEFARHAATRGVTVFYLSNRDLEQEEATRKNLVAAGFPLAPDVDTVLLRGEKKEWGSDKATRRADIAARYRVLVVLGDDLNDFVTGARTLPPEGRVELAERHADFWGERWIMLPNPEYGSWATALSGHERDLTPAEVAKRKLARLRLPPAGE